jgi:hypothetical protein
MPKQTVSFANQPLDFVLNGIKGRWRAVYFFSEGIAGYSRTPVPEATVGYYTWFYPDHITRSSNRAGDSLSGTIIWHRVDNFGDSLYAFSTPGDPSPVFGPGYAVFSIVNDTLSIGTVNNGPDSGDGILYKKD